MRALLLSPCFCKASVTFWPPYSCSPETMGPQNSSFRTQFMKRMVEFADRNNLEIVLVYYPPYHSKYNPIERCWGILEEYWNGTLLNTVDTALQWLER